MTGNAKELGPGEAAAQRLRSCPCRIMRKGKRNEGKPCRECVNDARIALAYHRKAGA